MAMTFSQFLHVIPSGVISYFRSLTGYRSEGLLSVEQVPDVLKEPYIFTGYRRLGQPWRYYLASTLFLHNESVNIWSHVLGFFLVMYRLLDFLNAVDVFQDKEAWPVIGFALGALFNLVVSSLAHLFHSRSRWHHFVFFLVDYMGVTFYAFGTGIGSMFICSTKGYHDALLGWFLPLNVLFSWLSFYACCLAKIRLCHDNTKRKVIMVASVALHGFFISMPALTRYSSCLSNASCSLASLNHVTICFVLICVCAVTFACHCPESLMPGCFDLFGHGHQIFHVVAVIAMTCQIRAMDIDVSVTRNALPLRPSLTNICIAFVTLFVLEVATLVYYVQFIVFRRVSQEIPRNDVQKSLLAQKDFQELPALIQKYFQTLPVPGAQVDESKKSS